MSSTPLQILRLSTLVLNGAYTKFTKQSVTDKATMARELAKYVEQGLINMNDISSCAPFDPVVANTSAVNSVANQAHDASLQALGRIDSIQDNVNALQNEFNARIKSLENIKADGIDKSAIESKVNELILDAFKPVQKIIADADLGDAVANAVAVHKIDRRSCLDVFGIDLPLAFDIYNDPSAPAIDPYFVWTPDILESFAMLQDTDSNGWLGGDKGTGKTQSAQQFSARTGRGFMRYNFEKYTEASHYLGDTGIKSGSTEFEIGDFLSAYTHPSTVILLDEISNTPADQLAPLNGYLEPNARVNYKGRSWSKAKGVIILGADNTLMCGDPTGRYSMTKEMNSSLADRFSLVIKFTHLDKALEIKAVVNHTGCNPQLASHIVSAIAVARAKVQSQEIIDAPSIRQIVAFIRALKFMTVDKAWQQTIVNRQPPESGLALEGIRVACLDDKLIQSLI